MLKIAFIKKLPNGKYRLFSRKKDSKGHRKNLGTFDSLSAAKKHEGEVQWFKQHAVDGEADDKETKTLSKISDIAQYLEKAGLIERAKDLYNVMALIDQSLDMEDNIVDHNIISDEQRNVENQGYIGGDGTAGGYSMFNIPEGAKATLLYTLVRLANKLDSKGNTDLANEIDNIIKGLIISDKPKPKKRKRKKVKEQAGVDPLAGANGRVGTGVTDNQNAGMFQGLSDAYFYSGYGNLEGAYGPSDR